MLPEEHLTIGFIWLDVSLECTFWILANNWLIFHIPINVNIELMNDIKSGCILYNFLEIVMSILLKLHWIIHWLKQLHEIVYPETIQLRWDIQNYLLIISWTKGEYAGSIITFKQSHVLKTWNIIVNICLKK